MLTLQGLKRAFVIKALAVVLPCASAGLMLYATCALGELPTLPPGATVDVPYTRGVASPVF